MAKQTTNKKRSGLVYSTDAGRHCPECNQPKDACRCNHSKNAAATSAGGHVYLQKESKGRAGKPVTTIKNLPLNQADLKALAKKLKAKCGVGGTVEEGMIIIQGDQREKIRIELESQGYSIKISGG
jgi:translation initiation factor 1